MKSTTSVPKLSSFSFNFLHKVPDPLKIALYDKHILSSHFPLGTYENCMTSQKTRYSPRTVNKITTLSIDPLKTFRAGARLLRHPVCRRPLIPSLTLTSPLLTVWKSVAVPLKIQILIYLPSRNSIFKELMKWSTASDKLLVDLILRQISTAQFNYP